MQPRSSISIRSLLGYSPCAVCKDTSAPQRPNHRIPHALRSHRTRPPLHHSLSCPNLPRTKTRETAPASTSLSPSPHHSSSSPSSPKLSSFLTFFVGLSSRSSWSSSASKSSTPFLPPAPLPLALSPAAFFGRPRLAPDLGVGAGVPPAESPLTSPCCSLMAFLILANFCLQGTLASWKRRRVEDGEVGRERGDEWTYMTADAV